MASSFREAAARGRKAPDYAYSNRPVRFNEDGTFNRYDDSEVAKARARASGQDTAMLSPAYYNPQEEKVAENKAALKDALYNRFKNSQYPASASEQARSVAPTGSVTKTSPVVAEASPSAGYFDAGANDIANVSNYNDGGLTDNEKIALGYAAGIPVAAATGIGLSKLYPIGQGAGRYYAQNPLQLTEGASSAARAAGYTPVGGYKELGEGVRAAKAAQQAAAANGPATAFKGTPVGGYKQLYEGYGTAGPRVAGVKPDFTNTGGANIKNIPLKSIPGAATAGMLAGPVLAATGAGLYSGLDAYNRGDYDALMAQAGAGEDMQLQDAQGFDGEEAYQNVNVGSGNNAATSYIDEVKAALAEDKKKNPTGAHEMVDVMDAVLPDSEVSKEYSFFQEPKSFGGEGGNFDTLPNFTQMRRDKLGNYYIVTTDGQTIYPNGNVLP